LRETAEALRLGWRPFGDDALERVMPYTKYEYVASPLCLSVTLARPKVFEKY
jgi:hypothetical protein